MIRHRKGQPRRSLWGRWLAVCIALGLVVAALVYHHQQSTIQQQRVEAAAGLATGPSDPVMPTGTPSGAPSATPTPPAASQTAPAPPASAPASSAPATPVQTLDAASASLPPTKFIWPAAGMSVTVVPMDWSPDKAVDPPLDGNGFDPTGHWLKRTGQTSDVKPKVVAGHTCYSPDRKLCNDQTFPFNRLSFAGWAVGQPAAIVNTAGQTVSYSLLSRQIVDKSKAFTFNNDSCLLVVYTCYQDDPLGKITLVTFHRDQCT